MKTSAAKKIDVLKALSRTEDEKIINEVYQLLYPDESIGSVIMEDLPEDLQLKLGKAMSDYRTGNYITNDQMKEKMQQWLKA